MAGKERTGDKELSYKQCPPKIASERLWNVEAWVRERGERTGGASVCQAQEGGRPVSKAGRGEREGREEGIEQGGWQAPAP